MATVNQDLFNKFKKLSKRQEADGIEVEVREDEDQGVKLQEIIDLLVAAGYFRARIKGLSSFDKVVGGMTWCIESCNVDVDVDLLFQENSTIGQKIALTEKIVAVLPKLKCPHLIEPHQIQGLDFIHIFPVIQWLVKRSMEYRQEMSEFVRTFAVNQFHKTFVPAMNGSNERENNLLQNVNHVNEVYRPRRYFKRKTSPPEDLESRVQITLLEYGSRNVVAVQSGKSEELEDESPERFEKFLSNVAAVHDDNFLYDELNQRDREKLTKHYASLQNELEDGGLRTKEEEKLQALEEQKRLLNEYHNKLNNEKTELLEKITNCSKSIKIIQKKKEEVLKSLEELETEAAKTPESIKEIEDLVIQNDNIRNQELIFREQCKLELSNLQNLIEETKKAKTPLSLEENNNQELQEETEKLKSVRLQLAKKNRIIAGLQRQLDDVPSRAELAQYQRRFLELYNQVAAKHKETKQYYTLYNTLEDTRQYMKKEMSLLNSISDSYPEAMQSTVGKEEFLEQFENIVESIRQTKVKVERRLKDESQKRDQLSNKLQNLVDVQRKYAAAVRQLSIECKKHESTISLLQNT